MCGLWGGVNPRFSNDLFEFLFPAGFQGVIWTPVILGACIGLYLLGTWILRLYTTQDQRVRRDIRGEIAVVIGLGIFVMPVAVAIGLCLAAKTASYIKLVFKSHPNGRDQAISRGKRFLIWGIGAWAKAFFFLIPVAGVVIWIVLKFPDIAWCLFAGTIAAIVIIAIRRVSRLPNFLRPVSLTPHRKIILKTLAILFPVVCSAILYWETLGKTFLPVPEPTGDPTTLKIVTYNIRMYKLMEDNPANNWDNRKAEFVPYLRGLGADIIGVQEAYLVQLQDILAGMPQFQFTGLGRENGVHLGEHSAILFNTTKFRLVDGDTFWLSNCTLIPSKEWDDSNYRVCTWARFEVIATGAQFCVFNTHYGFGTNFNALATTLICSRINTHSGDLPTFATGDFNMYNTSQGYAIFESNSGKPMKDSYRLFYGDNYPFAVSTVNDWTIPDTHPRIDFVFCSPLITVTSATIPQDHRVNGFTFSDHFPVVVECSF